MKILDLLVTTYLIAYFQLCVSNFFVSSPPEEKGQGMQKNLRTKSYVRRSTSQGAKLGGELRWIRRERSIPGTGLPGEAYRRSPGLKHPVVVGMRRDRQKDSLDKGTS